MLIKASHLLPYGSFPSFTIDTTRLRLGFPPACLVAPSFQSPHPLLVVPCLSRFPLLLVACLRLATTSAVGVACLPCHPLRCRRRMPDSSPPPFGCLTASSPLTLSASPAYLMAPSAVGVTCLHLAPSFQSLACLVAPPLPASPACLVAPTLGRLPASSLPLLSASPVCLFYPSSQSPACLVTPSTVGATRDPLLPRRPLLSVV